MEYFYTIAGFVVGFVIGLTGVGGGSLMTPILVMGFGIAPALAVGTDLLYAAITKAGGIFVHHKNSTIKWPIVKLLALGSLPSSLATILLLNYLNSLGINYESLITTTLGIALILTALAILFRSHLIKAGQHERFDFIKAIHRQYLTHLTIVTGVLLGVLVTLSSVGAGALGAAILFFLYPRMRAIEIVGTDLAHAVPLTAIAGLGHLQLGSVDFSLLGSLILGSLPGIYLGSQLGSKLPDHIVRPVLASMLFLIGLRLAL